VNQKSFNSSIQKVSAVVLALALVAVGNGAHAAVPLNTPTGGYLICVNTKTTVATYPAKKKCPKRFKKLILGATGSTGKDGRTLWNGDKDPDITKGQPGDMFLNTTTKVLFGPKDLIAGWSSGFSIVGPQGPGGSGPAGATGAPGASATLTCAQGGTCIVGNTGPGGGIVFYVHEATAAAPWRYLEAAPNTWSGGLADPFMKWCSVVNNAAPLLSTGDTSTVHTLTTIGSGFSNTRMMLHSCTYGAANMAASYNGGGKSDWFLPSKAELSELYSAKATVGGFQESFYWTSFEASAGNAYYKHFQNGDENVRAKSENNSVRPIRAF
jgi:hypothetical protein